MRVLTIKSFLDDQILGGELYGFGTNVFSHLLGFPLTHLVEGHIDHLAGRALLAAENEEGKLGSFGEGWLESETEVFNHENCAFGVLSLNGLSLVAGLIDRLVVQSHVGVLDVAGCLPVVFLEESDVDGPLQSGGRAHQLAGGQFSKGARADLLAFLCSNSCSQKDHQG